MKKLTSHRLELRRATLHVLDEARLAQVGGGTATNILNTGNGYRSDNTCDENCSFDWSRNTCR